MTSTEKSDEGKSKWAPGEMADGSISIMTEDEARTAILQRDADEKAFDEVLGESPDELDLDALTDQQLDELIESLS